MEHLICDVMKTLRRLGVRTAVSFEPTTHAVASCDGRTVGVPYWQQIRTYGGLREGMRHTLIHEVGHAFRWQNAQVLRAAGAEVVFGHFDRPYPTLAVCLLHKAGRAPQGYVSSYARAHPEEDFAETFAHTISAGLRPARVKDHVLQGKLDFMMDALSWGL